MTEVEMERPEGSATPAPALARGLTMTVALLGGLAATAKTVNRVIAGKATPLRPGFEAEEDRYDWAEGAIHYTYTRGGSGEPLLLAHGVGFGASAFEWRANASPLAERFTVYTCDLLGFGRSDKPPLHYTGELYVRLLRDFIQEVIGQPVSVVASGLTAAYVVALACREPAWFHQLILVCPTGITAHQRRPGAMGRHLYRSLSTPVLGESIYNSMANHNRVENYLRHELYHDGSRVTPELVDHYWSATHQPGARWAIRSYLSGYLNINIREEFRRLERPVTLVWGQQAHGTPISQAQPFMKVNPDAELEIFSQAGLLPHDERADEFNRMVEERLTGAAMLLGGLPTLDKDQGHGG
jgi:pimeloyl-ACP methyl ester carboxylesterase